MATPIQRWQAIGDALLNKTATPSQLLRLGQAYAYNTQQTDMFEAMTNTEKAQYCLDRTMMYAMAQIRKMDSEKAAATAAATAGAAVDTEFAPAP
jgi:hypothetical protein